MKYLFYIVLLVVLYIGGVAIYNYFSTPQAEVVETVEVQEQNAVEDVKNSINLAAEKMKDSAGNDIASVTK